MMTRLDSEVAVCHLSGLMQPWLIARLASMECASLRLNTFSALEVRAESRLVRRRRDYYAVLFRKFRCSRGGRFIVEGICPNVHLVRFHVD